jgi:enamine deaminase RidA (YjgF/YER057c/UK114 family)
MRLLQPAGWPRPKGYANGIEAEGRLIFTAGLVGWDSEGRFPIGMAAQFRQTMLNVIAVLAEAGAEPRHIVRMTWYITDKSQYLACGREIGEIYRGLAGKHFPAMAVVQVAALMEDAALLEIETIAVVPKP